MPSAASWQRVARGVARVAQEWVAHQGTGSSAAMMRLARHGGDLTSASAAVASWESVQQAILVQAVSRMSNGSPSMPFPPGRPPMPSAPSSTATDPWATPSRREAMERDAAMDNGVRRNAATVSTSDSDDNNELFLRTAAAGPSNQESWQRETKTPVDDMPDADLNSQDTTHTTLDQGVAVPATRFARAWGFAQLGASLAMGTARQGASRLWSPSSDDALLLASNEATADQVAATLCRMRGAALKLGQMLSIQDASLLPPALHRALAQVRSGATAMPTAQLHAQLESQLGAAWRQRWNAWEDAPLAAASIGQVHAAQTNDGRDVVVKVQFPGVAQSITSDLKNLGMLVKWSNMAPPGLFLDNIIRVGQAELSVECDYERELQSQQRMQGLVASDPFLQKENIVVPTVLPEWSTKQVLTMEYMPGGAIDKVSDLSPDERNRIGRAIMYLTMQELFVWRFMQTDPNWGNFLYDVRTRQTSLIDFGATREYSKEFVDGYLRIVWAAANRDESTLVAQSHRMEFLTGEENAEMARAHVQSGFTVGEPFQRDTPFDFQASRISTRMSEHTSVFLQHRLTAPPAEVYTLHRKLAGAYMLCIHLGAVVTCRDLLENIVRVHRFEDGLPHPMEN